MINRAEWQKLDLHVRELYDKVKSMEDDIKDLKKRVRNIEGRV